MAASITFPDLDPVLSSGILKQKSVSGSSQRTPDFVSVSASI
jgi:hypothetical protein